MFYKIFPIAGEIRAIPRNIASRISQRDLFVIILSTFIKLMNFLL